MVQEAEEFKEEDQQIQEKIEAKNKLEAFIFQLKTITDNEMMKEKLNIAINQFSKRQMTFFRRMEKRGITIHWHAKNKKNIFMLNIKQNRQ